MTDLRAQPETSVDAEGGADPHLLAYLRLSFTIGATGALLPLVLVVGERALTGDWDVRGSMSAYYHSGVRDVFVGMLVIIGFFLMTHHVATRRYVNMTTTFAGLLVTGVALFPTKGSTQTQVQELLGGEDTTRVLHFVCAIPFLVLLGFLSGWFGRDADHEAQLAVTPRWPLFRFVPWFDRRPWSRWGLYHRVCGATVLLGLLFVLGAAIVKELGFGEVPDAMFWGEAVAVVAFSASWLARGLAQRALIFRALKPAHTSRTTVPGARRGG